MKIIMPLAGKGTRFQNLTTIPKPLIPIGGKPMIQWPIECIFKLSSSISSKDFTLICLREHEEHHGISSKLRQIIGSDIKIRFIDEVTEGAAATVLTAEEVINNNEDILTCDCDQYFICEEFWKMRNIAIKNRWAGLIPIYKSDNPAYSYAQVNKDGNVIRTAEKQVISQNAAIGIYYFSKGNLFVRAAKEMIGKNIRFNNEFYMCPVYNELIKSGDIVRLVKTEIWQTLGTPAEAEDFLRKQPFFDKSQKKSNSR